MRKFNLLFVFVTLAFALSACTGTMNRAVGPDPSYLMLEQAQQTVAVALEYHDQGGYEKSARLFLEAANLFRGIKAKDEERRSLIAAAKVQLKCSQRQPFLLTMVRYRGLIDHLEMPQEDERFLMNIADHMKGKPLTYPVKDSWQVVFND